ncbi:MAG: thioesterase domain-containing protein [Thalassobaculaceae bacterium]
MDGHAAAFPAQEDGRLGVLNSPAAQRPAAQRPVAPAGGWLLPPRRAEPINSRVFCWPYAGLGASLFVAWSRQAPPGLGIYGIQPPGRESRMSEPPLRRVGDMVSRLADAMAGEPGLLDAPYALLGCSFGGIASFELARTLVARGLPAPAAFIVVACRPPHRVHPVGPFSTLDDDALADRLDRDYGGVPEILRQQPDLLRLFLPTLRADLEAMEHYVPPDASTALDCPVLAIGGAADDQVPGSVLEEWTRYGGDGSAAWTLAGRHFLVRDDPAAALAAVLDGLGPWLP